MYEAMQTDRYHRQGLIRAIKKKWSRPLICYVARGEIDRDDIVSFVDLLHNLRPNEDLDLLLHTPGGDIDAAEKLMSLVHDTVGTAMLRVIIPDYAKSAGTLMALGSHRIVMSDTSELGPIDPQINLNDGRGNRIQHSLLSYLESYDSYVQALRVDPNDAPSRLMLSKFDPGTIRVFEALRTRVRHCAESSLRQWMFNQKGGNVTKIASDLMDISRWPSHGQMINWRDATQIGLEVEHLDSRCEQWMDYWRLYCHQRLAVKDHNKLFESDYASLLWD
jgi:hypothetical protein